MTPEDQLRQAQAFISRFNRLPGQPDFDSELAFWLDGMDYIQQDRYIIERLIIKYRKAT